MELTLVTGVMLMHPDKKIWGEAKFSACEKNKNV
jgi:hypothetical protein